MGKKIDEILQEAMASSPETWEDYAASIEQLHIARFDEIPDLNLYMDQLISFVGQQVAPFKGSDEKPLTASMVNNYVKRRLVPQPQAKRYQPVHAAYLIVVCILKRVCSMDEIERLISLDVVHRFEVPQAYDKFIDLFEATLKAQFAGCSTTGEPGGIPTVDQEGAFSPVVAASEDLRPLDRLYLMLATAAASKIYVEQALVHQPAAIPVSNTEADAER